MKHLILLLVGLFATGSSSAQQPSPTPPLPAPPFLSQIPPGTLWKLERAGAPGENTNSDSAGQRAVNGLVLSRESIKSETVRRDVFLIAPSLRSERWMSGGYLLIGASDPQNIVIFSEDAASRSNWLDNIDYSELSWVGPSSLVGWEKPGESRLLVFEAEIPIPADGLASTTLHSMASTSPLGVPLPKVRVRALVDAETKRPVSFFDGRTTYQYSFTSGQAMPALPEEFRIRLEAYLRRKQSLY